MSQMTDPTFYRTPADAIAAPPERLAYVAAYDPAGRVKDATAVLDCDPSSSDYGQVVGWSELPTAGNELHHFGWNACSSALCHQGHGNGGQPLERRYLIVPGIRSSRMYVLDTKPDSRSPTVVREITAEELAAKAGYSRPHTIHCGPGGIDVFNQDGAGDNDGPGVVISVEDLSASVWLWHTDGDRWAARKVVTIPAEPADPDLLPPALKPFGAVPPLISDIDLSVDDRWLYVSCWGTGELKQYDVADPFNPRETGSVRVGGIVGRTPTPRRRISSFVAGHRWWRSAATASGSMSPTPCTPPGTTSSTRTASAPGWPSSTRTSTAADRPPTRASSPPATTSAGCVCTRPGCRTATPKATPTAPRADGDATPGPPRRRAGLPPLLLLSGGGGVPLMVAIGRARLAAARVRLTKARRRPEHPRRQADGPPPAR
jgi:hypothetical protein